jgi:hypothetical protein
MGRYRQIGEVLAVEENLLQVQVISIAITYQG